MKVKFKVKGAAIEISHEHGRLEAKTPEKIGRFLTQNIIRPEKFQKLIEHEVHGAAYTTLKDNPISNRNLIDHKLRRSDAFFRFEVLGRADCLPTPANLGRWFPESEARIPNQCRRCGNEHVMTMAHLLNECTPNFGQITQRHDSVCKVIRESVIRYVGPELSSDIHENVPIGHIGLTDTVPDELKELRPDSVFDRMENGRRVTELIEVTCPYGYISHEVDTLERAFEEKKAKYRDLSIVLSEQLNHKVRLTPVVVSSMGAVFGLSMVKLNEVLRCDERHERKVGRKMSDAAITGSMKIWQKYVRDMTIESVRAQEEGSGGERDGAEEVPIDVDMEEMMAENATIIEGGEREHEVESDPENETGGREGRGRRRMQEEDEDGDDEVTDVELEDLIEALSELDNGSRETESEEELRTSGEGEEETAVNGGNEGNRGNPEGGGNAEETRQAFRRQGEEVQAILAADTDTDTETTEFI
jgi:hypothetical protein